MNVVPAQVAGVESIAVASPPQKEHGGLPHPTILAACALLGVDEVYAVGGAQAIAMFAYGRRRSASRRSTWSPGPGNIYVAAAKRLVRGVVGIDAEAGPTEIAILADDTADPVHVAADLISQAEHDPLAARVLVTDSAALADAVEAELRPAGRRDQAHRADHAALCAASSRRPCWSTTSNEGLAVVDAYAAEHLEIQTADARSGAERVRNAGAIFVGPYSPVSLGDYCAGSNHVLPTGVLARHASACRCRRSSRACTSSTTRARRWPTVAAHVVALAEAEDLPAHGEAVSARLSDATLTAPRHRLRAIGAATASGAARRGPYGAPQLDVPVRLNTNENPYPPSPRSSAQMGEAVARGWPASSTATPTARPSPCAPTWPPTSAHGLEPREQVWAANGSNEVMQQLLQAFGGPGRTAMGFAPTYSMHPEYARDTHTALGDRSARRGLRPRRRGRGGADHAASNRRSSCWRRRTTRPVPRCRSTSSRRFCDGRAGHRGRRRGVRASSAGPAPRARWNCCRAIPRLVVTRTMSKAFALAGVRLGYLAATPEVVDALRVVRLPYHLSA